MADVSWVESQGEIVWNFEPTSVVTPSTFEIDPRLVDEPRGAGLGAGAAGAQQAGGTGGVSEGVSGVVQANGADASNVNTASASTTERIAAAAAGAQADAGLDAAAHGLIAGDDIDVAMEEEALRAEGLLDDDVYDPDFAAQEPATQLVSLSQMSDLQAPDDASSLRPRKKRWEKDEADEYLRKQLVDEAAINEFLASKWIDIPELQRLESVGIIKYKRGKYLEAEKEAVREHLRTFQSTHNVADTELVDIIMSKGRYVERSKWPSFWFDIAAKLPGRPVRYVKDAVKRMYDPRARKGLWTKEEDEALLRAYEEHPNQWSKISDIVDRTEIDCRDRWKHELRDRGTRNTGPWSKEEVDSLVAAVTKAAKDAGIDPSQPGVPWDTVVELMGRRRTTSQCRKKWRDHLMGTGELTLPVPTRARRLDRRVLIARLRELGVQHENDIQWNDLPTNDWIVKPSRLRMVWSKLRQKVFVPDRREIPFSELLERIESGLDEIDAQAGGLNEARRKRTGAAGASDSQDELSTSREATVQYAVEEEGEGEHDGEGEEDVNGHDGETPVKRPARKRRKMGTRVESLGTMEAEWAA